MPAKPRLLLLDAGAVMVAMQFGVWDPLCAFYEILVPSTVVHEEAQFYRDRASGNRVEIDLVAEMGRTKIREVEATPGELRSLRERFDPSFREGLHEGESEALCYLLANPEDEIGFVTGDGPAWKALAMLDLAHRACCLETALQRCGRTVNQLPRAHTKGFQDAQIEDGSRRRVTGEGLAK